MLFMVIEHYRNRDATAVYQRFRQHGRMLPRGLNYIDSWVEDNYDRCFQLMETENPELFREWTAKWADLVNFEIINVVSSREASAVAASEPVES